MQQPDSLYSIDAEQSVIGALLIDPLSFDRIGDKLSADDFYRDEHRIIYRQIAAMCATSNPVDIITVAEALEDSALLDRVGGLAYLGEVAAATPSAANITSYARQVTSKAMQRRLMAAAGTIAEIAQEQTGVPIDERVDRAQSVIMELSESASAASEPVDIGSILPGLVETIEARWNSASAISGLHTGLTDLDTATCGLQPGDLIIVAGRPSMGKTTLAVNIAEHVALNGGVSLVFSLEMNKQQLASRCLSSIGGIHTDKMRSGKFGDDDFTLLSVALGKLVNAPLVIDDSPALSPTQMLTRARRVRRQKGRLDLIVIDYLQLMSGEGNNRNEELGKITRSLKMMARDLNVPVICLSQLSRKVEERTDKRPVMSDLRESGSIEQDADVILMMYRDDYYRTHSDFKGFAEAILRKQRMGESNITVMLAFQGQYSRFRDPDKRDLAEAYQRADAAPAKKSSRALS